MTANEPLEFVVTEEQEPVVQAIGPFRGGYYKLTVNGCKVPNVVLLKDQSDHHHPEDEYEWYLTFDERFGIFIKDDDELNRWGWMLAQAMAVSAGFTYHGPDSKPRNLYNCRMIGLPTEEYDNISYIATKSS